MRSSPLGAGDRAAGRALLRLFGYFWAMFNQHTFCDVALTVALTKKHPVQWSRIHANG
jgi:hypothetical protein